MPKSLHSTTVPGFRSQWIKPLECRKAIPDATQHAIEIRCLVRSALVSAKWARTWGEPDTHTHTHTDAHRHTSANGDTDTRHTRATQARHSNH
jgi:hypothetical protein